MMRQCDKYTYFKGCDMWFKYKIEQLIKWIYKKLYKANQPTLESPGNTLKRRLILNYLEEMNPRNDYKW